MSSDTLKEMWQNEEEIYTDCLSYFYSSVFGTYILFDRLFQVKSMQQELLLTIWMSISILQT